MKKIVTRTARPPRPARGLRRALIVLTVAATAVLGMTAPASADSGGGCQRASQNWYVSVCISVRSGTSNPLWADFYVDRANLGETLTKTYFNITCPGSFTGYYAGDWRINGAHSPQWQRAKTCSHGNAYTHTVFYNSSGGFIYSADSPTQYW